MHVRDSIDIGSGVHVRLACELREGILSFLAQLALALHQARPPYGARSLALYQATVTTMLSKASCARLTYLRKLPRPWGFAFGARATSTRSSTPVYTSKKQQHRQQRGMLDRIDLLVCDMAGTTVEEGGLVYQVLRQAMLDDGLEVSEHDMHPWHGAKKEAVIANFSLKQGTPEDEIEARVARISDVFLERISLAYFEDPSSVGFINADLPQFFHKLRKRGIKIGLDTGYPPEIQNALVQTLGFEEQGLIDGKVSSYSVKEGRPYPYMIYNLMEQCGVMDISKVAKVGDSVRDIEMGLNAGCGLVIGVLSGADSEEALLEAGADVICNSITDLPLPLVHHQGRRFNLPDLS